jgi:hypothetical protein
MPIYPKETLKRCNDKESQTELKHKIFKSNTRHAERESRFEIPEGKSKFNVFFTMIFNHLLTKKVILLLVQ